MESGAIPEHLDSPVDLSSLVTGSQTVDISTTEAAPSRGETHPVHPAAPIGAMDPYTDSFDRKFQLDPRPASALVSEYPAAHGRFRPVGDREEGSLGRAAAAAGEPHCAFRPVARRNAGAD